MTDAAGGHHPTLVVVQVRTPKVVIQVRVQRLERALAAKAGKSKSMHLARIAGPTR
jgi:hypothetical protein